MKVTQLLLTPLREVRYLKDTFENLMTKPNYAMFPMDENGFLQDFYYLTLTDETMFLMLCSACRLYIGICCSLIMTISARRRMRRREGNGRLVEKTPLELIDDFYRLQNNQKLSEEQKQYLTNLLSEMGGDVL